MKEDFLHYVWKFRKFDPANLLTEDGESIQVMDVGEHNFNSGPDFFNAQVSIGEQSWAGNVEIHIKSSHWYLHRHEIDSSYDNVILHVVWEDDVEVFRRDNTVIPTLVLKPIVAVDILDRYYQLFAENAKWIACEDEFAKVDDFVLKKWLERLFFERLEQKTEWITEELKNSCNHWEALLFRMLCKNFGLKVNGDAFISIAQSLDFAVVQKCRQNQFDLETVLLGQAGLLEAEKEDSYYQKLQKNYAFLMHKFKLRNDTVVTPKFFRLRPVNFPTIRLSQLAALYSKKNQLFSEIISLKNLIEYYTLFDISASDYWNTHYNFGTKSAKHTKALSKRFVELLLINTILPLRFYYEKQNGKEISEELLQLALAIKGENNTVIKKFNELRPLETTAFESQALLQLKTHYCEQLRCMECTVGNYVMRS